jgi:hypothetical protein
MPEKRKETRETKTSSEAAAETVRCLYGTDSARLYSKDRIDYSSRRRLAV